MSSRNAAVAPKNTRERKPGVQALLDAAFGFFLWAGHFLVVYIATAVACQLGLGTAGSGTRTTFLASLALVTVAAAAVVAFHAVRRYRQLRDQPDRHFRMSITIGNDAVATVAIAWQLLAVTLVPLCA